MRVTDQSHGWGGWKSPRVRQEGIARTTESASLAESKGTGGEVHPESPQTISHPKLPGGTPSWSRPALALSSHCTQ